MNACGGMAGGRNGGDAGAGGSCGGHPDNAKRSHTAPFKHCVVARLNPFWFPLTTIFAVVVLPPVQLRHSRASYVPPPSDEYVTDPAHGSPVDGAVTCTVRKLCS